MQVQTDTLQITPLATAPLRGTGAAASPRSWAVSSEHRHAKLMASFITKCLEHLFSNSCHKTSCWEWKLLGKHFLPTSDQLSYTTTWQNGVLHWKHLDWTKHQAICLSWTGTHLGRSSTLLLLKKIPLLGFFLGQRRSLSVQISGLTYLLYGLG